MTLYGYRLLKDGRILSFTQEADEKKIMLRKSDGRFFEYAFRNTIRKDSIGKLQNSWGNTYVYFTEESYSKAAKLFLDYIMEQRKGVADELKHIDEVIAGLAVAVY